MDHSSRDLLTVSLMNIGDKELNDVVCAAYRMGCEQTREVYKKRIEKLEAALRDVMEMAEVHEIPFRDRMMYVSDIARKAQERTGENR
jgi:hypothetical protein